MRKNVNDILTIISILKNNLHLEQNYAKQRRSEIIAIYNKILGFVTKMIKDQRDLLVSKLGKSVIAMEKQIKLILLKFESSYKSYKKVRRFDSRLEAEMYYSNFIKKNSKEFKIS